MRLHEMVMEVKMDREVGLAYMKAYEIEQLIETRATARGLAKGRAESVLILLAAKGTIPTSVEHAVQAQTDMEILDHWLLLAAGAESVEEFQSKSGL